MTQHAAGRLAITWRDENNHEPTVEHYYASGARANDGDAWLWTPKRYPVAGFDEDNAQFEESALRDVSVRWHYPEDILHITATYTVIEIIGAPRKPKRTRALSIHWYHWSVCALGGGIGLALSLGGSVLAVIA